MSPSPTKPTTRRASSWSRKEHEPNPCVHAPLIIDVAGTALTPADRRRLADPHVGGVIHFARNWESRAQLTALNAEIKALRPDMLICVDHEGGRVQRFRTDGFTHLPAMRALGELWMRDAMRATQVATSAPATCWPPSCAPAASTSASRRCSTSTTATAA